eukprot:3942609-Amphidinium_carterae.3
MMPLASEEMGSGPKGKRMAKSTSKKIMCWGAVDPSALLRGQQTQDVWRLWHDFGGDVHGVWCQLKSLRDGRRRKEDKLGRQEYCEEGRTECEQEFNFGQQSRGATMSKLQHPDAKYGTLERNSVLGMKSLPCMPMHTSRSKERVAPVAEAMEVLRRGEQSKAPIPTVNVMEELVEIQTIR